VVQTRRDPKSSTGRIRITLPPLPYSEDCKLALAQFAGGENVSSDNLRFDAGPLPKSDSNAELQRESIKALNAFLRGQDDIFLRDERVEDYGVDGCLELKFQGGITNFRSQVQIKATAAVQRNRDGSISFSVSTANLNYLLNGVAPIYLLYEAQTGQFWYTWARDQSGRLEAENKGWRNQATVTLRFNTALTKEALGKVYERILAEGRFRRELHDTLAKATESEPVIINIDSSSLSITDPTQARDILLASGSAIVAAGFPQEALRLFALLDAQAKGMARIRLAAGYAYFTVGEHYTAIGSLRIALAAPQGLSNRDRSFLETIMDAAEFHIGLIDRDTYQSRLQSRASARMGLEALEAKQDSLFHRCIAEPDPRIRASLVRELSVATNLITNHPDADRGIKLDARLVCLYIEGMQANFAIAEQISSAEIRSVLFPDDLKSVLRSLKNARTAEIEWEGRAQEALREAYDLRHPVLLVQALTVSLQVRLGRLLAKRLEAIDEGVEYKIPTPVKNTISSMLEEALAICTLNGAIESRLRLKKIEAEFLEIQGDDVGAKRLAEVVNPEAAAMQLVSITGTLSEIIEDRSLIARYIRERLASKDDDPDNERARMSDEQLARLSRYVVEIVGSPPAHARKVYGYMRSLRIIAQERCRWCRHLQMLEDLRQTSDPQIAFSETPSRKAFCDKFKYQSEDESVDVVGVIENFKTSYCAWCQSRDPKGW
jgi:hypothetical protein